MAAWEPGTGRRVLGLGLLAALIGVVTIVQGTASIVRFPTDSDMLVFFLPAAERIASGEPFRIYDIHASNGALIANPPLSFFWLAIPLGLAQTAGNPDVASCLASDYGVEACRTLVWLTGLAFMPFVLLLGAVTVYAARQANARLGRDQLLIAAAVVLLSPLLWLSYTAWWHPEQALMLLLVVAGAWQVQSGRPVLAGVLFGLGLLTRTTALGPVAALLTLLAMDRSWRSLVTVGAVAAGVVVIGILPYALFDPNLYAALVGYRGVVSIGNSIWSFIRPIEGLAEFIRAFDGQIVLLATVAVAFVAARWRGVTAKGSGAWGVMALSLLLVTLLGKRIWPYYYAEALVIIVIWEVAARSGNGPGWRFPTLSLVYLLIAATLAQYMGLQSITDGGIVLRMMAVAQFVGAGVVALGVWMALRDDPEPAPPEVAAAATV
ncbi:MAG: glycosyltransferase 87 family protein [Chloroflexi bacterium]|nr:glycosyltransferase 87 family protein [Chloroflexota bacterium]